MQPAPPEAAADDTTREAAGSTTLLSQAQRLVGQRRWDEASRLYRELLAESPDHVDALEGLGLAALQAGQVAEGLAWLSRARERAPDSARVLSNFGLAQKQSGLLGEAIETYRRAVALAPSFATLVNLGRAEREAGRLPQAIATFRRAVELDRRAPDGWSMLSNVLREAGRLEESLSAAREALSINPWHGQAHLNEGAALHRSGQLADAIVSYWVASRIPASQRAATSNLNAALADRAWRLPWPDEVTSVRRLLAEPRDAQAMLALARRERDKRRAATALCCFECAAEIEPSSATYQDIGALAWGMGQHDQAQQRMLKAFECADVDVDTYRRLGAWLIAQPRFHLARPGWKPILQRCPEDWVALVNLGVAIQRRGFPSESESLQRRALAIDARRIEPYANLGVALNDQGRTREAVALYRECLALNPDAAQVASNLLFALHFDPELSPEAIFAEHVAFGRDFAEPLRQPRSFAQSRDPERRLRVGYVSPDFRWHPVSYFVDPVLSEHDPQRVEVHCYSDAERPDEVTTRFAGLVHRFTPCRGWTDERLAEQIAADQIDILVDLAGHTGNNRLLVFARKPSPVQASWLGYFDTTGVSAIDYRITDEHSVPAAAEAFLVERVVRLPRSSNCFRPTAAPEPAPPPCLRTGQITFGCYNNPAKIQRDVIATFARILHAVPGSRIVFKYAMFDDLAMRARYSSWLEQDGISLERVDFLGHSSLDEFMASFARIDIALDPFPYSGETTALHTLWMGVPLVALEGLTLVQRLASRVLRVAGLSECVATSSAEYVQIARELAARPERLTEWRSGMRQRLRACPLFDYRGVTRELEAAYREMWRTWCSGG